MTNRSTILAPALEALEEIPRDRPTAVIPVTGEQWRRSLADAAIEAAMDRYETARRDVADHATADGAAIGRELRPAALRLAAAAADVAGRLELLQALDAAPRRRSPRKPSA